MPRIPDGIRDSTLLTELWRNSHVLGRDNFICVTGRKGTGKSLWVSMGLGLKLDPHYIEELEKQTVYDLVEFAKLIADAKNKHRVLILDESGLSDSASSMRWWEKNLQALRDILQVDRIRNQTKIMIAPRFKFVAKFARDLFNYIIDVRKINKTAGYCEAKVMSYEVGQSNDVEYKKYLRTKTGDKIQFYRFWQPPQRFMKRYNDHSLPYKDDIMQKRLEEMIERSGENDEVMSRDEKIVNYETQLAQRLVEMFRDGTVKTGKKKTFDKDEVAVRLTITHALANKVMGRAKVMLREQGDL